MIDHPWRYNIGSPLNDFGFDTNNAHLQPGGLYHYHGMPSALYDADCSKGASPVVGFAADGFPVFGNCIEVDGEVRSAVSSYQLKTGQRQDIAGFDTPYVTGNVKSANYDGQFIGDYEFVEGSGDLDICNGRMVNGQYGYVVTSGYPYVLACYSGAPSSSFD